MRPRPSAPAWAGSRASLGELTGAGLPVPPGFAVTTHVFRQARDKSGSVPAIRGELDGLDTGDPADVAAGPARSAS